MALVNLSPEPQPEGPNGEIITRFIAHLRAERGSGKNTVESFKLDLNKYAAWLARSVSSVTRRDAQQYISSLIAAGKSGRTAARKLCCLRTFYRFLMDEGEIEHDPTLNIPGPRTWKKLPRSISQVDIEKMVASLGTSGLDIRDKAMLLTFFGSGLRESELAALKLSDIDLEAGILKVWGGKGDKDAMLPMSALSIEAIKQYVEQARPSFASRKKGTHLFLGRWGGPLTRQQVFNRVRDIAKAALTSQRSSGVCPMQVISLPAPRWNK